MSTTTASEIMPTTQYRSVSFWVVSQARPQTTWPATVATCCWRRDG
jgi:hypothetical protein